MFGSTPTNDSTWQSKPAFGAASTSTPFGSFGATPTTNAFGSFGAKPAFGGFGFGQPANNTNMTTATTGVFGQPAGGATTQSAFGSSSLFPKTTTGFGSASQEVANGTAIKPYAPTPDKDSGTNTTLMYQSITCMPTYSNSSFEELRLQDYAQGRKTASAFATSTGFGAPQQPAQPATSLFGNQTAQANPIFGGTTGSANPTTGFGAFGQNATTGSLFGQPQQQAIGFNQSFGQPQQQQATGFNQSAQQQSGGLFGNATAKPAFSGFGGATNSAFGGTNAFGSTQTQQTGQQPGGLFGVTQPATTTNVFGAFGNANNNAPKPLFGTGSSTTQPTTNTSFNIFGQTPQQQNQQPQTQQTSAFPNLFGASNAQPQQQQPGTQAGNLFGSQAPPATTTGTGLFGTTLFGNNQQQNANPQSQQPSTTGNAFNLFNKPTTTTNSLFSGGFNQQNTNNQPQQGGILGTNLNQPAATSSLFGKPAAPLGNSLSNPQSGGLFSSLQGSTNSFSAVANNGNTQGNLTASISQPIGSDLPIFSMLPPGPRLVNLDQSSNKKKAGFFVDIPTRSPIPRVQLKYTPANSKLRGFGSSSMSSSTNGNPIANAMTFTPTRSNSTGLIKSIDNRNGTPGPDGFIGRISSPALGSGGRQSVKKVILDKKVEPSELFVKSGSPGNLRGGKVTFSPALSFAAREKEAAAANATPHAHQDSPTPASRTLRNQGRFTASSTKDNSESTGEDHTDATVLEDGDYWVKPDLPTLKKAGYDQLSSFKNLSVGRVGYGEIHFLEPVDLTGLPKLGTMLGDVVRFDDKECSVYPEIDDVDKPPPGSGLNVKARIILERCWAADRATRQPIKDPSHPNAVRHLKRLKNMKDTHFEGFDVESGRWTFTVDHF